jgi:hypothetical protein
MNWLLAIGLRFLVVCSWVAVASAAETPLRTIDLENVGYQHVPCGFHMRGQDAYAKRQIEFLDDEHLLIHFATPDSCLYKRAKPGIHTAVIDVFGKVIHTYDWQTGEDVTAGPDGKILILRLTGVQVVGLDFQAVQTIPWQHQGYPHVVVTPSRNGFAIVDRDRSTLFKSTSYQAKATTTGSVAAVGDDGFVTVTAGDQDTLVLHVNGIKWMAPKHSRFAGFADAGNDELFMLDTKFNLYRINQPGNEELVARMGWLAPGIWNSGFRFDLALPEANRILLFSHGARIAFSDTSGVWTYFRTAVLDLKTGKTLFQWDGKIGDDVSLSPNGHIVAARQNGHLALYNIP